MPRKQDEIIAHLFDKKNRLIATGHNSYTKTHPKQKKMACKVGHSEKIYLHAEIDALIKAKQKKPFSIHVYRYNKDGMLRNAFPCPICLNAIMSSNIKQIFFSNNENSISKYTL